MVPLGRRTATCLRLQQIPDPVKGLATCRGDLFHTFNTPGISASVILVILATAKSEMCIFLAIQCSVVPTPSDHSSVTDVTEAIENGLDPTPLYLPWHALQNSSRRTHLLVTHLGGYPLILTPDRTPDPS